MSTYFFENSHLTFHQYIRIHHSQKHSTSSFYKYSQMYLPFSFSSRIPTVLLFPKPRKVIADTNDTHQCLQSPILGSTKSNPWECRHQRNMLMSLIISKPKQSISVPYHLGVSSEMPMSRILDIISFHLRKANQVS